MAKTIPWVRTIVIIFSMLVSQLPWMSAAASAPVEAPAPAIDLAPVAPVEPPRLAAAPAPGVAELPLRQVPLPGECKIKVLAAAVDDYPDSPDPSQPPSGTTNPTPFGATAVTEAGDRTELLIWFVIMNWTGMGDPGCAAAEAITIDSVSVQVGDVSPNVFLSLPATLNGPTDYIEGRFTYGISSFTPSPINISMTVSGTDAGGSPVQDLDDSWSVTLSSPGFEIVSFTPSVTEAVPGDLVDFTLRVRNTRAGVDIDSLAFQSLDPAYRAQCNDIGDWTGPGGGLLVTPITQGGVAECIIHNVSMPPDTETGEYRLTGTITAGSGGADPTEAEVESDPPVVLHLASIRVTKRVVQILRGTEVVSPPAQPGDRITYEITVENTSQGGVAVDTITIQDSLTGRVPGTQGVTLAAGESQPFPTVVWTVLPNSQDPLTNIASVTARAVNTGRTVSADAAASVDIADSALRMELVALDPVAEIGDTVRFAMTLYNDGDQPITGLAYAPLGGTLRSFGTLPALGGTLPPGASRALNWTYTIQDGDPDPLINTVRVTGTVSGRTLAAQEQAVVDITNPAIGIVVTVVEPATDTVLRGGEAIYAIEVTNKGAQAICGVQVSQLRVDPDTGQETPIIPSVQMGWPDAGQPGRLEGNGSGDESASASTTYLVTSTDKDPLHMVFRVTALSACEGGGALLTDRTSRVLNISDVQVNAEIGVKVGGVAATSAEVGEFAEFTYLVTNAGTIPLSNVSATYCFLSRTPAEPPNCAVPLPLVNLQGGALLQYETATGIFTTMMTQADADQGQFPVEVTLYATDNRGRDVTLKTTTVIDVTTPDVLLEVTGPAEAVNGDTHSFTFVLTNNTGADLTDVQVFRLTDPANPASGVPVGSLATLSGQIGNNTYTGSFDYTLDAPPGATTLRLTLRATATRGDSGAVATASHDIKLIPLILVEKTGPAVAVPGESVTYHVVITNQSVSQTFTTAPNGLADDVLARYNVPVSADDFTWPGAAGVIPPGESASADFVLPDVQADVSPLINTFSVSGTNNAGQAASGVGQHEMEVTCPVIFQFRVTEVPPTDLFDDAIHILNETLRWEITLVNTTQSELTNVSLTESLNWGGPVPAGAITWPTGTPGVIPPNGTATLQPFEKMITNDYYPETIQDVYMTSRLVASFSPVASRSECAGQFDAPLFSPVTVIKEADTSIALTGDTVTYTITMINMAAASDPYNTFTVTLTDPLLSANPIPMYYNGAGQPATMSGVMGPGEIVTGPPLTYVVKDSDPDKLINTATAEFPDPADPETTFYTIGQAEVLTINPLTLVKTPSALNGIRGTTIYYDYELTNNTEYEIEGIRLVDDRIGQLIPGTHTEPPWTTLTLGGFETFTISGVPYYIEVDAADPVVNTATATGTIHLPGGDRDLTAEATVAVDLEEPDIEIEKTARDAATGVPLPDDLPQHIAGGDGILEGTSGQQIEYCFTVTNNSPSAETYVDSIVIEDVKLGAGALQPWFLAAVEGKYGSRTPLNRLYGGESVEFCYETAITLNRAQGDPQTNTVTLTGVTPSGSATIPVYTDDSLTIDLIGTDILITKSASQPLAYIGQDVTYTIRIENRNDSLPINDIALFDSFLGEVDLAALDWSANNSGGNPGSLGVGGVATLVYSYTIQPRDPDPLINSASVSGTLGDDQNTPVEDATQSSLAITPSQLLVRKFPSVARSLPEKTVRYTIAITNVGQIPVYDLRATDTRYTGDMTPSLTTLMPNKTAYITYDLVMPTVAELSADPTLDPYVNTVTVEGTVYDTQGIPQADPVTGQATAAVDIIQPNVSISKVAQVEAATPGNDVTYTITIRNTGGEGDTLSDVVFTDVTTGDTVDLDSVCPGAGCGFVYGAEPYFDDDGNAETPMVPNPLAGDPYDPAHGLQHGEFLTGEITVTAPPATQGSEFTNVVEIEASLDATTVRDRSSATIDIRQEGIRVTKRADTATATIGQSVQYTVAVENTGTVPFTRVTIADVALPGGTATITGGFPDTAGDAGTLDPGEVYEHVYTHQITPADGDPYTNRASVSAYTAAGAMVRNDAWVTVDVQLAELSVEKFVCAEDNPEGASAPDPCTAVVNVADAQPDTVYYYVHIANPSIVPIENISVDDPLAPPGAFDASAWPGGQNALAANDGAPGGPDEAWFKYTYTVTESDLDVLWNTVTVSGQTPTDPPQTAEDVARAALRLVTGDLQLTKTGPAQAQIGESVTYTLSVTHLNPQGDPITNITIVDPLSASGTQPVCTIATLAPGATDDSCTFSRTVALGDPAPLVNQAFAQGTQASAPGGTVSDTATHTLDIVTPGLSVSKTASVPVARFGDTVTFTYVVQNTGQGEISSLVVTDSDPQIVFSAPWPTRLPAGQTVVRTATRTLTALDPDPYTNTLTVTGRRGGQTVRAQASATVALSDAALAVSNVPDRQYALDGQAVIFAYTARNLGSEPLNNLTFSDNGLCAGLDTQLVSTTLAPRSSVTVYCTVNAALPGPLVSTVRAAADAEGGPVSDTATAQVQVTTGGLLVSKTANRLVATPGDTIRYTITVTNVGDEPLHNLALFESMGIDLVPPLPATLQPGASATLSGEVAVPAANPPDSVANSVSVTAIGANTQTRYQDNASAAVAILEDPNAVLALTKQANTQTGGAEPTLRARPTDSVMYTFTVRNVSSETATGITLSDPALGAPIPLGDLGPGETATLSGSAAIPPDHAQPTFDNTASVSTGGAEPVLQDTASASVPVQLLGLTKTADAAEARPGEEVLYTFTVESFTQASLDGVTLEDEGLTLDTPLPGTIPPEGASASGRMTVPADFLDATFVNTAALRMNGVWLDEASASVEVVPRTLEITLDSITQPYQGGTLDLIQTGEEAEIAFTLRNAGTGPIVTVAVNASVAIPDSAATATCTRADGSPLPFALQVGQEIPGVCRYTPPAGLASYLDAGGLTPLVTLTASGDPGGGRVEVTASDTMPLVDLALTVDLAVTPDSVPVGGKIKFTLTLRNDGASPIGCDVAPDASAYCALRLLVGSGNPVLNDLLDPLRPVLEETVLLHGDTFIRDTLEYQIGTGDFPTQHSVTVYGGYYDPVLEAAGVLDEYVTSAQASATLLVELPALEVRITRADPFGIDQVVYGIEIKNTGNVELSSLAAEFTVNSGAPVAFTLPADTIAPGETVIASYLADETQTEPYTLAVKASGTTPSGTVVEDTDSVRVIPGVPLDALRVTIDSMIQNRARLVYDGSAERPFQTGYPIIIQFTVTNDGDQAVSDVLPDFYSDMDPEGGCYPLDYPETITPLLAPGASITRICEYVPPVGHGLYPTTGSILPSITFAVTGYIDGTEIVGHNDQKQVKLVDLALRVELGAEPTRILPGGLVTFTLSVVNFGASPIGCGSDVAPNSLCHLKLSSPNNDLNAAIAGFSESLKNDVLPPRYSRWFTVTVPMPQPQPNQLLANYAVSVEGGYHDTQIQDVVRETFVAWDTSDVFLVYQLPRLQVSVQAAPNPPVFGQPVAYTVNVTNTGFAPVTITSGAYQIIPLATTRSVDGIVLTSGHPQTQPTSGTLTFTPTTLLPGQSATATVAKTEDQRGTYIFRATVNGFGLTLPVVATMDLTLTPFGAGTPTPTVDPATLDPNATEPQITKEPSAANVQPGGAITWTIKVRNGSTSVMPGVVMSDTVPPTMVVASAAADRGQATVQGSTVNVAIGTLNPGETATITINTTLAPAVTSPATVTNTACAARQGGANVCKVGTVTVGPGVGTLPATGLRSSREPIGWRWDGLLGFAFSGALMLFLSVQVSQRRRLAAILFVLVALAAIGGAVALVLTSGGDEEAPEDAAQAPPVAPAGDSGAPAAEAPAGDDSAPAVADVAVPTPYIVPTPAGVRTLMIPKLSETFRAPIPILELPIINRQWDVSGLGYYIGWLDGTTWLEPTWGNTVLAAHVQLDAQTPGPFWGLSKLVPGDEIIVREGEIERVFVVMSTRKVAPDDWTVTAPTDGPTLTLITCTDWSNAYGIFAQRLVVQAIPVT